MERLAMLIVLMVSVGASAQGSMSYLWSYTSSASSYMSSSLGYLPPSSSYMPSSWGYMPPSSSYMPPSSSYMPPSWWWGYMSSSSSSMPSWWLGYTSSSSSSMPSWWWGHMSSSSSYMPPSWWWGYMSSSSSYMPPSWWWGYISSSSSYMPPSWWWGYVPYSSSYMPPSWYSCPPSYWSYMSPHWSLMPTSYWPTWSFTSYPRWNSHPYTPPMNPGHSHDQHYQMTCWEMGYDVSDIERHVDCLEFLVTQQHMFTQFELEYIQQSIEAISSKMDIDNTASPEHVRLVGGPDQTSGRVEIFHDGMWGTVCDDYWDDCDARVVCRMLGYNDGRAFQNACFGEGWGDHYTILLDDVHCDGHEDDLLNCPRGEPFASHNCIHHEDAGVVCINDTSGAVPECNPDYDYWSLDRSVCVGGIAKREAVSVDKRDTRAARKRSTSTRRRQVGK